LAFEEYGLVYPGADDRPDPSIKRACRLRVQIEDLLPWLSGEQTLANATGTSESDTKEIMNKFSGDQLEKARKKFLLLCGDDYNPISGQLTLHTDRFPEYGENKKWIVDTLINLITVSRVSYLCVCVCVCV
jgi:hypothetical protein